jgi:Peptidase family S41/Tricorn protease C1 domain
MRALIRSAALRSLLAILAFASSVASPLSAQRPVLAGNWRLELVWPEPVVLLALVEEGDSVRGTMLVDEGTIRLTSLARTEAGFDATVSTRTKEFVVRAAVRGDSVSGEWTGDGRAGRLRGWRVPLARQAPIAGTAVFDSVVRVLEQRFYDPGMNGADWPALVARLRPRAAAATGDGEAYQVIRELLAGIGGSHLGFSATAARWDGGVMAAPGPIVSWGVWSPEVGYLRVRNFSPTGDWAREEFARLDSAFARIGSLPALVIDLRGNPGGSLDLAARLAQHLVARPTPGGYFVTQSGYTSRGLRTAQALDPATVPPLSAAVGAGGLMGAVEAAGGAAMVYVGGGGASSYAGKVAILTDRRTGSAAEAVAAALREVRGAVTVGERTAGAMLSSTQVQVAQGWWLRYPAMDYRTPSGMRLEGDGVPVDVPAPATGEEPIRAAARALGHPLP